MNGGTWIALGAGVVSWLGLALYAWLLLSRGRHQMRAVDEAPVETPTVTVRDAAPRAE